MHFVKSHLVSLRINFSKIKLLLLCREIKTMEISLLKTYFSLQINHSSDSFLAGTSALTDPYSDMEFEYNEALLETILAAGNSASNKRNSSKRLVSSLETPLFK